MDVLVLSEEQVREMIDLPGLLNGLEDGFRSLSRGDVNAPERNEIPRPDGSFLLSMPGHRPRGKMTVKIVTVFEANLGLGLPSHLATIGLYDADTGACQAFMDGTYITAIRTSAAAALSARILARDDAETLTIIGAGVQGQHHLQVYPLARKFREIRIASLHHEDAERLAAEHELAHAVKDVEHAVRTSDIVALATHSGTPVIEPEWISPGTHVSSVGYRPPRGELPPALLNDASLFVETRLAFSPTPVGCAELDGLDPSVGAELGEVLLRRSPGRQSGHEITIYKAMGHVIEDVVAAELAYRAAKDQGVGQTIRL
jgi:alanine dehydrogenase